MNIPTIVKNMKSSSDKSIEELLQSYELKHRTTSRRDLIYAWETKLDAAKYKKMKDPIDLATKVLSFLLKCNDEDIHGYFLLLNDIDQSIAVFYSESRNEAILVQTKSYDPNREDKVKYYYISESNRN